MFLFLHIFKTFTHLTGKVVELYKLRNQIIKLYNDLNLKSDVRIKTGWFVHNLLKIRRLFSII